jgi:hypothetical protein
LRGASGIHPDAIGKFYFNLSCNQTSSILTDSLRGTSYDDQDFLMGSLRGSMMNAPLIERRTVSDLNSALAPSKSDVIRKSLLMREEIGTMSAFEYLKSHAVRGSVIHRVLAEGAIRAEDRAAMQATQALPTG